MKLRKVSADRLPLISLKNLETWEKVTACLKAIQSLTVPDIPKISKFLNSYNPKNKFIPIKSFSTKSVQLLWASGTISKSAEKRSSNQNTRPWLSTSPAYPAVTANL